MCHSYGSTEVSKIKVFNKGSSQEKKQPYHKEAKHFQQQRRSQTTMEKSPKKGKKKHSFETTNNRNPKRRLPLHSHCATKISSFPNTSRNQKKSSTVRQKDLIAVD